MRQLLAVLLLLPLMPPLHLLVQLAVAHWQRR